MSTFLVITQSQGITLSSLLDKSSF